jgi:hypothetical protein
MAFKAKTDRCPVQGEFFIVTCGRMPGLERSLNNIDEYL